MKCRTPSSALALAVALCLPAFAAASPSPADRFQSEVLAPAVQNGLQDDVLAGLADKLSAAKAEPDESWATQENTVAKIQDFGAKFKAAKDAYKNGAGTPTPADQLEDLRSSLKDIIDRVGIADKGGTLEAAYLAQLAPLAAVNEKVGEDVQRRMKLLEAKLPPGKKAQYQDSISKFNEAASAGNWQDANTSFRSLYDNMKNDGSPDLQPALGQANVIARGIKPRPADSSAQFTSNKSQFDRGLKIVDTPAPYSDDEARKLDATTSGKHFGAALMAGGGGVLAWTGAAALGIVSAPAAGVILLGFVVLAGGYAVYKVAKNSEESVKEGRPEDEQDINQL